MAAAPRPMFGGVMTPNAMPRAVHFARMSPLGNNLGPFRLPWAPAAVSDTATTTKLTTDFSGTWIKDKSRSDNMDEAINLMALGGLMRQAIKLIKGVQIKQDDDKFVFSVLSVFSWFKVTETYPLSGAPMKCRRRDFRRGGHIGCVEVPSPDKLKLCLKWNDPHGGSGEDVFSMPSPDELIVDQTTRAKEADGREKEVSYRSVYTRKK